MLRAGRRSGKTLIGAHAVREELTVPGARWWVCGPTFKHLHDATMPAFLRLVPPDWVKNWNLDNLELELTNGAVVQFRSLDDPERARGQGLHGAWLDEAAYINPRAWDVLEPSLAENAGICIATTSPAGYDWSYHAFFKKAVIEKEPGYWARRYRTIDNPIFATNEILKAGIEHARKTKTPEVFAAEYEGEDVNFTGAIYGQMIASQVLATSEAVKKYIPEWPKIDPTRPIIIGLDSGADHTFGAVLIVVTEGGLVVVAEYLERHQALSTHLVALQGRFDVGRFTNVRWAANKNEAQLRLEFGLRGVGVIEAENRHQIGIQRVQSWLCAGQLFFAYTVPMTIEQSIAYRWANNYGVDGQKRNQEDVFKINDELPDAVRYAIGAWPELPKSATSTMTEAQQQRWDAFDHKTREEITQMRAYNKRAVETDLEPTDEGYPLGGFYSPYTVAEW
jgi:phage terminase large subunit